MSGTTIVLKDDELCLRTNRQTPVIKLQHQSNFLRKILCHFDILFTFVFSKKPEVFTANLSRNFFFFFLQTLVYFQCQCLL